MVNSEDVKEPLFMMKKKSPAKSILNENQLNLNDLNCDDLELEDYGDEDS